MTLAYAKEVFHICKPLITTLLHLLRLPCGGHSRQLALENLALRQQLAVDKRTGNQPTLRKE